MRYEEYKARIAKIAAMPRQGDVNWLNAVMSLAKDTGVSLTAIATNVNEFLGR